MNRHALQVLEFPEAVDLVAGYASSTLGAQAVRALHPSDALAWVGEELRRVDQMTGFLLRAQDWFVPPIPDLRAALQRLGVEGSVWDGVTLHDTAELLRGGRAVRRSVLQHTDHYPLLGAVAERLASLEAPEERIRAAIDDAGGVRDTASRELARLRREIRAARSRMVQKLEQFIGSLPARFQVPDVSVSVRDGRYVIPIRREGRSEVGGIVHDESATGNTLFVEPPISIELMNELRGLELAEAREVHRILRELTDELRPHRHELAATLETLIEIDSLFARGRYALEFNGRRPEIVPRGAHEYVVVEGYHPLLLAGPERVVPFDLRLEPGERTLLVSGPNTGGKTVLLKAIGLISALAQAGIIPPVGKGTRLPLFTDIFADIGDEQSIEASLSTFSAHLRNLREILDGANGEALALIDEIGSGTDPAEGGALAQAILIELTRRDTLTVATSHLGQLKLLASEQPGVVNASLQFDAAELRPTYRLLKGIPGRSYGLAIARRLRFPEDILARAEGFLSQAERDVANLLLELEAKERALETAVHETDELHRAAEALRRETESRAAALAAREKDAAKEARHRVRELLLEARQEVERAIRDVREAAASDASRAELEETFRAARRRIEEHARQQQETETESTPLEPAGDVRVGARVRLRSSGAEGTLIELRDDRATVEAGGVRIQVSTSDLVAVAPTAAAGASTPRRGSAWSSPDLEVASEIDLRGLRAEEVATQLLPALDAAIQAGLPSFRIIHGKGTGALREVVTELLRADRRIGRFRAGGLGEGGGGVTVVELS